MLFHHLSRVWSRGPNFIQHPSSGSDDDNDDNDDDEDDDDGIIGVIMHQPTGGGASGETCGASWSQAQTVLL